MDSNIRQSISTNINSSLQNIPNYNAYNFVEDSLLINSILNSELRNPTDFKQCLNKLRAILREHKKLFCSLFTNLITPYLSVLKSENLFPEEYIFLLVDIIHNKPNIEKYFKKWIKDIIISLLKFYAANVNSKENEQLRQLCLYIEFLFDEFASVDEKSINYFIYLFDNSDVVVQKMSAFFFFKYIYNYDINKIKIIDWGALFESCAETLDNKYTEDNNKAVVEDIFKQLLIYFNKLNVDPNDALIEGKCYNASKFFQTVTGFNTDKSKERLRDYN